MTRLQHRELWREPLYEELVRGKAASIGADGCTGVPDFYLLGCLEHDIAYRTHCDPLGAAITKAEADLRFKWYIQQHSWFGSWSPMAWWRWGAVKHFADRAWNYEHIR